MKRTRPLSLELLSILNGYPRDFRDVDSTEDSMCVAQLPLQENGRYPSMGVDSDPDIDGNLSNSARNPRTINNRPVLYRNEETFSDRRGNNICFRKGTLDWNGNWDLDTNNCEKIEE